MLSVRDLVRAVPTDKVGLKIEANEEEMREGAWDAEKKEVRKVYSAVALDMRARLKL